MDRMVYFCSACLILAAGCSSGEASSASETGEAGTATASAVDKIAASAIEGPALAPVLDFKDAVACEWSVAADTIFENSKVFGDDYVTRPGTVAIPGIDKQVTAKLSRPDAEAPDLIELALDFKGEWLGLQVTGLSDMFYEESGGIFGRAIRFDASLAETAKALSAAGFRINADGSERAYTADNPDKAISQDDFMGEEFVLTWLEEKDGETQFGCNLIYVGI